MRYLGQLPWEKEITGRFVGPSALNQLWDDSCYAIVEFMTTDTRTGWSSGWDRQPVNMGRGTGVFRRFVRLDMVTR